MKKGSIFEPLLLLALLISLTYAFYIFQYTVQPDKMKIGELQGNIIKTYGEGERVLFFIERSALWAREQAIRELGENAGMIEYKCKEDVDGELLWVWDSKCNANEIEKNYFTYLNKNLNFYFDKYEDFKIEKDNYEFEIKEKKLMGKSKKPLEFWIYKGILKVGNYYLKPDFYIDFDYDLNIYNNLYEKALYIENNCKDENCAKEQLKDYKAEVKSMENFFDVEVNEGYIIKFLVRRKGSLF